MQRTNSCLAWFCLTLILVAAPAVADESSESSERVPAAGEPIEAAVEAVSAPAGAPAVPVADVAGCAPVGDAVLDDAVFLGPCFVQMECDDESVISCNGNSSCSTGGPGGNCVICDGVQEACCSGGTCCQGCARSLDICLLTCGGPHEIPCSGCVMMYNSCIGNCTGGCP